MTQTAIQVENIGKEYQLGQLMTSYHTLRDTVAEHIKIGKNRENSDKPIANSIWALRNVTFDVHQGQVLGRDWQEWGRKKYFTENPFTSY